MKQWVNSDVEILIESRRKMSFIRLYCVQRYKIENIVIAIDIICKQRRSESNKICYLATLLEMLYYLFMKKVLNEISISTSSQFQNVVNLA